MVGEGRNLPKSGKDRGGCKDKVVGISRGNHSEGAAEERRLLKKGDNPDGKWDLLQLITFKGQILVSPLPLLRDNTSPTNCGNYLGIWRRFLVRAINILSTVQNCINHFFHYSSK